MVTNPSSAGGLGLNVSPADSARSDPPNPQGPGAVLLIVLDGAADRPEAVLDGETPLEIARTPNLDELASTARAGLLQVLPNGGAPQTHSGMLSLLGYPGAAMRARRGCLEASIVFGEMRPGCLYARGNLSSIVDGRIPSRRVNRDVSQAEADAVCALLNSEVPAAVGFGCRFESYSTYRLTIELETGAAVSDAITGTDPGYASDEYGSPRTERDFVPVPSCPSADTVAARQTSKAVNDVSVACAAVLDDAAVNIARRSSRRLPINYILMRDFGVGLEPAEPFLKRWHVKAKYFHDLPVEVGVARYLAMDDEKAGCTSVTVDAFANAAERVIRDLDSYGLICFHVKGPDEPGHDRDWRRKVSAIETVDQGLIGPLLSVVQRGRCRLAVTSDHATCWSIGTHTGDPVPVIVTDPSVRSPGLRLTEKDGRAGSLMVSRAWDLMPMLLSATDHA